MPIREQLPITSEALGALGVSESKLSGALYACAETFAIARKSDVIETEDIQRAYNAFSEAIDLAANRQ